MNRVKERKAKLRIQLESRLEKMGPLASRWRESGVE